MSLIIPVPQIPKPFIVMYSKPWHGQLHFMNHNNDEVTVDFKGLSHAKQKIKELAEMMHVGHDIILMEKLVEHRIVEMPTTAIVGAW